MDQKRPPVMEDYLRLQYAGEPCCRDGQVAWTASWWDMSVPVGFCRFREEVRLAKVENERLSDVETVTAGGFQERSPIIAADGSVWFLSDASLTVPWPEDGTVPQRVENELFSQLQLYRWENGAARQMTHMRHGINRFFLSPDERRVCFLSWKYDRDGMEDLTSERTDEERTAALKARLSEPFVTESQCCKSDGELGYRSDRTELLWLLEGEMSAVCWTDRRNLPPPAGCRTAKPSCSSGPTGTENWNSAPWTHRPERPASLRQSKTCPCALRTTMPP